MSMGRFSISEKRYQIPTYHLPPTTYHLLPTMKRRIDLRTYGRKKEPAPTRRIWKPETRCTKVSGGSISRNSVALFRHSSRMSAERTRERRRDGFGQEAAGGKARGCSTPLLNALPRHIRCRIAIYRQGVVPPHRFLPQHCSNSGKGQKPPERHRGERRE